jgi:fatty acid desaturase
MDDAARIRAITLTIKEADRQWRRRLPWLRHQDAIGVAILAAIVAATTFSATAYLNGWLPWWACIALSAFSLSLARELEHDLVHNLYFRGRRFWQNAMMGLVWPLLGNLPHPWFRRDMHLLHHRTSGQTEDFEERLIGNGMKFGPLKILAMIEPGLAMWFRGKELESIPFFDSRRLARACFPVVYIFHAILLSFAGWHAVQLVAGWWGASLSEIPGMAAAGRIIDALMVVYVAPNMVRQISVQILSSWMHYYEDVPSRLHETQILNAWYFLPLNLFAANFGSTHAIHHFYANQPFYLRQLVARRAHAALHRYGVRYNDASSLLRGNRFN